PMKHGFLVPIGSACVASWSDSFGGISDSIRRARRLGNTGARIAIISHLSGAAAEHTELGRFGAVGSASATCRGLMRAQPPADQPSAVFGWWGFSPLASRENFRCMCQGRYPLSMAKRTVAGALATLASK